MSAPARVLIVDDHPENLNLLTEVLETAGFEVLAALAGETALEILNETTVDLVMLDILMPGMNGLETCAEMRRRMAQPPPVIFISASDESTQLTNAFASGGSDYISKPFRTGEVLARVQNLLQIDRLQRELQLRNTELERQIAQREKAETALSVASETLSHFCQQEAERWGLKAFIGQSPQFAEISTQIRQLQGFAKTNVLVLGESGSGKELVARALHFGSNLGDKPFIAINCSAISESLAEAEFFGNVKGAFTGAMADRKGYFEMADGGTLFLDEVGDLPVAIQAKLLRALEDGSFYPVGGKQIKRVNVRVISATNNDLGQKKSAGQFREDLYFRLAQFVLNLPPLRERLEDLAQLAAHFCETFAREMKIPVPVITDAAQKKLRGYHYPGNIRELKNLIERAVIVSGGKLIQAEDIQLEHAPQVPLPVPAVSLSIKDIKKQLANIALERSGGNVTAAARLLGVHRSWFYRADKDIE